MISRLWTCGAPGSVSGLGEPFTHCPRPMTWIAEASLTRSRLLPLLIVTLLCRKLVIPMWAGVTLLLFPLPLLPLPLAEANMPPAYDKHRNQTGCNKSCEKPFHRFVSPHQASSLFPT